MIPARIKADDMVNRSVYHPKKGPMIAKQIRITKFRTERTVALISDSVIRLR